MKNNSIINYELYEKALKRDIDIILSDLKQLNSSNSNSKLILPSKDGKEYDTLSTAIYYHYYKREYLYREPQRLNKLDIPFDKFINHRSKQLYGWKMREGGEVGNGGIIVVAKKEFYTNAVPAGVYLKSEMRLAFDNEFQTILIKNTDRSNLDPQVKNIGDENVDMYVHFLGEAIQDELESSKNLVRFYFNLNPFSITVAKDVQAFCEKVCSKLNRRKIPFHLKIHSRTAKFYTDASVLYIERRYLITVMDVLNDMKYLLNDILRKEAPMFAYPLFSGIGFAENPEGDHFSFGERASNDIAKSIQKCFNDNNDINKINVDSILTELTGQKIDYKRLFLNSYSNFEYNYKALIGISDYVAPKQTILPIPLNSDTLWMEYAILIGFSICKEAFWDDLGRCNWVGFRYLKKDENFETERNKDNYRTLDIKLLDGLAGTALFLSILYRASHRPLFKRYVIGTICTILAKIDKELENKDFKFLHGFHNGHLGVIWAINKSISNINIENKNLRQGVSTISERIISKIDKNNLPKSFNSVSEGAAGTLLGLLCIEEFIVSDLSETIDDLTKHLLDNKKGDIVSHFFWETNCDKLKKDVTDTKLNGLGYGTIGIAYVLQLALNRLKDFNTSSMLSEIEFQDIITSAIRFETDNYMDLLAKAEGKYVRGYNIDWSIKKIGYALAKIGLYHANHPFHKQILEQTNIKNDSIEYVLFDILRDENIDKKILRMSGSLDTLIECHQLGLIDRLKGNSIYKEQFPDFSNIKDFDFLKSLFPIFQAIEKDVLFTEQDVFTPDSELAEKKEKFNPSLLGLAGIGYAFLRIQDYHLVESYFIPKPTGEFQLKR